MARFRDGFPLEVGIHCSLLHLRITHIERLLIRRLFSFLSEAIVPCRRSVSILC